ncbi:phosphatidylglycerol lysyltransferase domain-containing protein [Gemmobacter denitrificans]|uniref:Phosphatidylglycerol lysyltransferase domain-containing protein n=1 Tax=Gemmobacter denitrificans TaxID=3123040 RepID=A0ABU8BXL1_9RHOB
MRGKSEAAIAARTGPPGPASLGRKGLGRAGFSLLVAGIALWLLSGRLATLDPAAVAGGVAGLSVLQWVGALAATALSFWAMGQYDVVMHRHLATGLAPAQAARAGMASIAVSQMLGMGLLTGSLMRWRLLPELGAWGAARMTAAVTAAFFAAWGAIAWVVLLVTPGPWQGLAMACLPALLALPALRWLPFRWPNLLTQFRLVGLAVLDLVTAALALWFLLPLGSAPPFWDLLPAFLLALGAGLLSGAPGGVGVFEIALLTALPGMAETPLMTGVLAFRLVYYALPAGLGALALLRPAPQAPPILPDLPVGLAEAAPRGEALLYRQGEHRLQEAGRADWLTGRTPEFLVALFDPLAGSTDLRALADLAATESRQPVIYKCGARTAIAARRQGWHVLRLASEARIAPAHFDLSSPACAGLRRKLRQADRAGLRVERGGPDLPIAQMTRVNAAWAQKHGGERGFSTGRFAPDYLAGQRVYLAWQGDRLAGFVSFHAGRREWVLDLMRHGDDMPEGTMQRLICAAIDDAAAAGVPRLSLAACPDCPALRRIGLHPPPGLRQFKQGFAPDWAPLYLALPHAALLPLALADLTRAIHRPQALPRAVIANTQVFQD